MVITYFKPLGVFSAVSIIASNSFDSFSREEIYDNRKTKFLKIGRDKGFMKSSNLKDKGMSYDEPVVQKFVRHVISNKYIYGGIGLVMMAGIISIFN